MAHAGHVGWHVTAMAFLKAAHTRPWVTQIVSPAHLWEYLLVFEGIEMIGKLGHAVVWSNQLGLTDSEFC